MDDLVTPHDQPVTEAALFAEKLSFWSSFTGAGTMAAGAIILLLLGMWLFLV
jgi:hypothetical protein